MRAISMAESWAPNMGLAQISDCTVLRGGLYSATCALRLSKARACVAGIIACLALSFCRPVLVPLPVLVGVPQAGDNRGLRFPTYATAMASISTIHSGSASLTTPKRVDAGLHPASLSRSPTTGTASRKAGTSVT